MQDKKREIYSRLALLFTPVARHIRLPSGSLNTRIIPEAKNQKGQDPKARNLTLKGFRHCQHSTNVTSMFCVLCAPAFDLCAIAGVFRTAKQRFPWR